MKICVIGPTYPWRGGISHYNTLLVKGLRQKHAVRLFSFKRQYLNILFPGKTQIDNSKYTLKTENEPVFDSMNPWSWLVIVREIKRWQPQLLIFNWVTIYFAVQFAMIAYLVKIFTKTKILIICHNVTQHEPIIGERIFEWIVFKNADYFIVHSEKDKQHLQKVIRNPNVYKAYHPIYERFKFIPMDMNEARKKLKIMDKNIILYFGFVRPYKGLIYLIEAMPMIISKIDVKLLIVGEFWEDKGSYLRRIRQLSIEKHVLVIDRYIPNEEVGVYFNAANVIVLPYISATQSGIIQMAFGFNKPVITTNVGGLSEVVKNGKTGYVVPPKDSKALAEAVIRYFAEDKEKEFTKNIMEEKRKFSWKNLIKVIESIANEEN